MTTSGPHPRMTYWTFTPLLREPVADATEDVGGDAAARREEQYEGEGDN